MPIHDSSKNTQKRAGNFHMHFFWEENISILEIMMKPFRSFSNQVKVTTLPVNPDFYHPTYALEFEGKIREFRENLFNV
jgi:hypothetical protein